MTTSVRIINDGGNKKIKVIRKIRDKDGETGLTNLEMELSPGNISPVIHIWDDNEIVVQETGDFIK